MIAVHHYENGQVQEFDSAQISELVHDPHLLWVDVVEPSEDDGPARDRLDDAPADQSLDLFGKLVRCDPQTPGHRLDLAAGQRQEALVEAFVLARQSQGRERGDRITTSHRVAS